MSVLEDETFEVLVDWMLRITHFFFGPVLFLTTVWALVHGESTLYICANENTDPKHQVFAFSNLFALIIAGAISGVLTYYFVVLRLKRWL